MADRKKAAAEVIRLPASEAAAFVAARADEQPGFEEALRAGLAALCEELGLCGARAVVNGGRAIWHLARPGAVRPLLEHVRAPRSRAFQSELAELAGPGGHFAQVEAFAEPGRGRLSEVAAACAALGEV